MLSQILAFGLIFNSATEHIVGYSQVFFRDEIITVLVMHATSRASHVTPAIYRLGSIPQTLHNAGTTDDKPVKHWSRDQEKGTTANIFLEFNLL